MRYLEAKGYQFDKPDSQFYWQAYLQVRLSANERGFVPVSEVKAYCDHIGLEDPIARERLLRMVNRLSEVEVQNGQSAT